MGFSSEAPGSVEQATLTDSKVAMTILYAARIIPWFSKYDIDTKPIFPPTKPSFSDGSRGRNSNKRAIAIQQRVQGKTATMLRFGDLLCINRNFFSGRSAQNDTSTKNLGPILGCRQTVFGSDLT
jgi:hypothetical protein